ncbi:MAG: hypothetical protein IJB96_06145 [Lachnospira sp.]|nr:hypothetical protein [Lachnospira sp.]
MAYILNTCVYENTFKKFLMEGEFTNKDEVLADMDEPMGEKISSLSGVHNTTTCKAFVTTTTAGRVLVAVFDIWGEFHKCYCGNGVRDLVAKKCFGGSNISFVTSTQYGELQVRMYVANRQFGTDLKNQKEHKEALIVNLETLCEG